MDRYLDELRCGLERGLAGLDDGQTQLRPRGDARRWCIQQIAGHMRLTYAATSVAMEVRVARGSPTKGRPSLPQRVGQLWVVGLGQFPSGRKAPEAVTPDPAAAGVNGAALLGVVQVEMERMDERIGEAEALFGQQCRCVSHMILGPMNVGQWRRFHLAHGMHHLRQIAAIRREYRV